MKTGKADQGREHGPAVTSDEAVRDWSLVCPAHGEVGTHAGRIEDVSRSAWCYPYCPQCVREFLEHSGVGKVNARPKLDEADE